MKLKCPEFDHKKSYFMGTEEGGQEPYFLSNSVLRSIAWGMSLG